MGLSRIAYRQSGEDINEGDSRYLAPELLNDLCESMIPDLTKADIFSFGVSIYELMTGIIRAEVIADIIKIGDEIPKNGPEWHELRNGYLPKLDELNNYSNSLKGIVRNMMNICAYVAKYSWT